MCACETVTTIETKRKCFRRNGRAIAKKWQCNQAKIAGLRAQLRRELTKTKAEKSRQALSNNLISHNRFPGTDGNF